MSATGETTVRRTLQVELVWHGLLEPMPWPGGNELTALTASVWFLEHLLPSPGASAHTSKHCNVIMLCTKTGTLASYRCCLCDRWHTMGSTCHAGSRKKVCWVFACCKGWRGRCSIVCQKRRSCRVATKADEPKSRKSEIPPMPIPLPQNILCHFYSRLLRVAKIAKDWSWTWHYTGISRDWKWSFLAEKIHRPCGASCNGTSCNGASCPATWWAQLAEIPLQGEGMLCVPKMKGGPLCGPPGCDSPSQRSCRV